MPDGLYTSLEGFIIKIKKVKPKMKTIKIQKYKIKTIKIQKYKMKKRVDILSG